MKRYRSLFVFCLSVALAPLVWAQANYAFRGQFVRNYAGQFTSDPVAYADGTACAGEVLAFLYVVPEAGVTFTAGDTPPFSFASDGSLIPGKGVARLVWGAMGNVVTQEHGVTLGADGLPMTGWAANGLSDTSVVWPAAAGAVPSAGAYLYAVQFDTRAADPATGVWVAEPLFRGDMAPAPLSAWGATQLYAFWTTAGPPPSSYLNLSALPSGNVTLARATRTTTLPAGNCDHSPIEIFPDGFFRPSLNRRRIPRLAFAHDLKKIQVRRPDPGIVPKAVRSIKFEETGIG